MENKEQKLTNAEKINLLNLIGDDKATKDEVAQAMAAFIGTLKDLKEHTDKNISQTAERLAEDQRELAEAIDALADKLEEIAKNSATKTLEKFVNDLSLEVEALKSVEPQDLSGEIARLEERINSIKIPEIPKIEPDKRIDELQKQLKETDRIAKANAFDVRIGVSKTEVKSLTNRVAALEAGGGGTGDMLKATYDPTLVAGDAFDMDNMVQGTTNKFISAAQLTVLGNTSGTNTGDNTVATALTGTPSITVNTITTTGNIELGHASANTLSASGGILSVEGTAIPKGTGTSNEIAYWSGTNTVGALAVATYPSLTELSYVKGVTSAIQTQLGTMLPLAGGTMSGNITLGEGADPATSGIVIDASMSADERYSGITVPGTAGATLAFGDLCYLDVTATEWLLADADAAATSGSVVLGICVDASTDGNPTSMLLLGTVRSAAFPASVALGAPVYVDTTAGDITATQPSGVDDVIRVVGWAVTAEPNTIYFNPSSDYITHT